MIKRKYRFVLLGIVVLCMVACCVAFVLCRRNSSSGKYIVPDNLDALTSLSNEEIQKIDIAVLNLLCAEGLPGSENIDIEYCLRTLDEWAKHILEMESKYKIAFYQNLEKYENSYALFQGVYLKLALDLDYKCGYNMELVRSGAMSDWTSLRMFANSKDLFIHGFVDRDAPRTGTCGSLPVLMTAVGRRCGYPLFFVVNKGHAFCRWDDGVHRYNFECSGKGIDYKPDSYYMGYPHPIPPDELAVELFMQNLTPLGEYVEFLDQRAACLRWNKRYKEACEAYEEILKRMPHIRSVRLKLEVIMEKYLQ
jgi:tetratricopeptide (TPR) repeat protein